MVTEELLGFCKNIKKGFPSIFGRMAQSQNVQKSHFGEFHSGMTSHERSKRIETNSSQNLYKFSTSRFDNFQLPTFYINFLAHSFSIYINSKVLGPRVSMVGLTIWGKWPRTKTSGNQESRQNVFITGPRHWHGKNKTADTYLSWFRCILTLTNRCKNGRHRKSEFLCHRVNGDLSDSFKTGKTQKRTPQVAPRFVESCCLLEKMRKLSEVNKINFRVTLSQALKRLRTEVENLGGSLAFGSQGSQDSIKRLQTRDFCREVLWFSQCLGPRFAMGRLRFADFDQQR